MPLDQAHEQNNSIVKGSGGAVGLTENPVAFNRWMVAGPEQARLILEFEANFDGTTENLHHHETSSAHQCDFQDEVMKLVNTINVMGNPFLEEGPELVALDSHECFNTVSHTISIIKQVGQEKYQWFKEKVLEKQEVSIHEPIKRNNLPLFKKPGGKVSNKSKNSLSNVKQDRSLFSRLYISSQVRMADMDAFFQHENMSYPPSLSDNGELRLPTKKADLLECIDTGRTPVPPLPFDAKIVDGGALIHSLPTSQVSTFQEFAESVFLPWIGHQLTTSARIDIVWDSYNEDSLKKTTRLHRGKGNFKFKTKVT